MSRNAPAVASTESPATQVAAFIARFDPAIAKLIRSARARLRKRFPTAVELVYDNYNALANGNQGRFVRLETLSVLDIPAVDALLHAAARQAKSPLPPIGRGHTVIKSVSAKQRPRRPPTV